MNFKDTFNTRCTNTASLEQIEQLNNDFIFILCKATKKVARRRRIISFSTEKAKRLAILRYQKGLLGLRQGKRVIDEIIEWRKLLINLLLQQEMSIIELKAKVEEVINKQKELKEKAIEF